MLEDGRKFNKNEVREVNRVSELKKGAEFIISPERGEE